MVKREDWEMERKQLGGEPSSDAIIQLRAQKERERHGNRLIARFLVNKKRLCVSFNTSLTIEKIKKTCWTCECH